jgi:hypothetical protein
VVNGDFEDEELTREKVRLDGFLYAFMMRNTSVGYCMHMSLWIYICKDVHIFNGYVYTYVYIYTYI